MKYNKTLRKTLSLVSVMLLMLAALAAGVGYWESSRLSVVPTEEATGRTKTIVRNDVKYYPRQDIRTMMVLGIDQYGPVESSQYHRNSGSADSIMLFVFDETNASCSVLYLNRDTMLNMDVLGINGEYAGTAYGQLALAHTYGSGLGDSCENVKNTLEKFLHGLTVDYYVSMNMDAIPILNDAVGGVKVTVTDDFSKVNPDIKMGEMTLHGQQAIDFVRTRKDVGDQNNMTRMARQKEYVEHFLEAFREKKDKSVDFVVNTYDSISPYIVTDCSATVLSGMMDHYMNYSLKEVLIPSGKAIVADGHYQFYVDEEKLDELVVSLLYAPKNS